MSTRMILGPIIYVHFLLGIWMFFSFSNWERVHCRDQYHGGEVLANLALCLAWEVTVPAAVLDGIFSGPQHECGT